MKSLLYFRINLFIAGVTVFGIGISYYLWQRPEVPAFIQYVWSWLPIVSDQVGSLTTYPVSSFNWLPTFTHVVSLSLITLSVSRISEKHSYFIIGFWVSINVLFELGQLIWLPGTFDVGDIVAAVSAGVFIVVLINMFIAKYCSSRSVVTKDIRFDRRKRFFSAIRPMAGALVVGFGVVSISGSYTYCEDSDGNGCYENYDAEPVYMSYEELRTNAIHTEQNVPLTKTGKIYLYQNYLLVNTPNEGIHVYDNSDKQNPTHLTFINIPGNVDIAVKQYNLYVDSYIDLVVLDISNIGDIREVHRVTDIFPYNVYQNIPPGMSVGPVDPSKGVVIGYKEGNL